MNDEYAGPRLHAMIRASQELIPRAFKVSYQGGHGDVLPFYEDETAAIHRRDPEAARAACVGRSYGTAQAMLAELSQRRVFTAPDDIGPVTAEPVPALAGSDVLRSEPSIAL